MEECARTIERGLAECVVTNPTVLSAWCEKHGGLEPALRTYTERIDADLYVQLRGPGANDFVEEYLGIVRDAPKALPKLPCTVPAMEACRKFAERGLPVLVTTVCTVNQAHMAASSGATSISPFYSRLAEAGDYPERMISLVAQVYRSAGIATKIMPTSIRTRAQAEHALVAGAHGLIVYADLIPSLLEHHVTETSLDGFEADFAKIASMRANPG